MRRQVGRWERIRCCHDDFALVFRNRAQPDLSARSWQQRREALRPFEQYQRAAAEQIVQAEAFDLRHLFKAIEIDVEDRIVFAVLMYQRERRARYRIRGRDAATFDDAFRQGRLPRPQVADQQNRALQFSRQCASKRDSLFRRVSVKRS